MKRSRMERRQSHRLSDGRCDRPAQRLDLLGSRGNGPKLINAEPIPPFLASGIYDGDEKVGAVGVRQINTKITENQLSLLEHIAEMLTAAVSRVHYARYIKTSQAAGLCSICWPARCARSISSSTTCRSLAGRSTTINTFLKSCPTRRTSRAARSSTAASLSGTCSPAASCWNWRASSRSSSIRGLSGCAGGIVCQAGRFLIAPQFYLRRQYDVPGLLLAARAVTAWRPRRSLSAVSSTGT